MNTKMKAKKLITIYPLAAKFTGGADCNAKFEPFTGSGLIISVLPTGEYLLTRMVLHGTRFSRRFAASEIVGKALFVKHNQTGQSLRLDQLLAGEKFVEFDPVQLFGTEQPDGATVQAWLKGLWGSSPAYLAMDWVKSAMPLDVLLGFFVEPLPGVTRDPATGWHWSSSMHYYKVKYHASGH